MITINLIQNKGYAGAQLNKLQAAMDIATRVLNSKVFKREVIDYETNGERTFSFRKNLFKHFERYTNEQVYDLVMLAEEEIGDKGSGSIDLYLELLPGGGGSTVGYGNPGNEEIYTYADWFDHANAKEVANHIIHEWCHKIGFDHAKYPVLDRYRDNSVPYGIGGLIEKLADVKDLSPV